MSTTATNYINLINQDYPVRGKDNDSQGFRDNFTNITQALREVNTDLEQLKSVAVQADQTSTFFGNTIEDANFQNCSTELWDNGTLSGQITVDFKLGSYQKLTLESGVNNVSIINWPDEGKSGHLILSISPATSSPTTVNFGGTNLVSLGPSKNPFLLSNSSNVFELYSEYPAGSGGNTVFVRLLNELIANGLDDVDLFANRFVLRSPTQDTSNNHIFNISSSSGATSATIVASQLIGNPVVANVALIPNKVVVGIVPGFWSSPTSTYADQFQVESIDGITIGATFNVITTATRLTVVQVHSTNTTVECSPSFPTGIGTGNVIFRNPTFSDYGESTAFPTMVTLVDQPATTSTGRVGTFRGSIYADANTLEVTYADYGNNVKNTFTATIMPVTTVTDKSTNLANTEFVHNILPYGSIIMWYGRVSEIPFGWKLCDGTNNTPDLRDKFVVGANRDRIYNAGDTETVTVSDIVGGGAASTSTGGKSAITLPYHEHAFTATVTVSPHTHEIIDPGHTHVMTSKAGVVATDNLTPGGSDRGDRNCTQAATTELVKNTQLQYTGITETEPALDNTLLAYEILGTGTADVSVANIPPFYALCFIMKVTGN